MPAHAAEEPKRGVPAPAIGILILMVIIVALLGYKVVAGDGEAATVPEGAATNGAVEDPSAAVAPTSPEDDPGEETEPAASADAGAAVAAEEPAGEDDKGGRQVGLVVTSKPEGADVFLGEALLGQTPLDAQIAWGEAEVTLRVELEGYEPAEVTAIPFADVKRKLTLEPLPGTKPEAEPEPEPEAKPEPAKPAPKKTTKKRTTKKRTTKKSSDAAVPLLLEPMDAPKKKPADVPVF